MTEAAAIALGKWLKRWLQTGAAYQILDEEIGETWSAGGCWLLSQALSELLRVPMRSVWSVVNGQPIQHHVVVQVGDDCFIDSDGAQPAKKLLRKMVNMEWLAEPYLADFDAENAQAGGILCPIASVKKLKTALKKRL